MIDFYVLRRAVKLTNGRKTKLLGNCDFKIDTLFERELVLLVALQGESSWKGGGGGGGGGETSIGKSLLAGRQNVKVIGWTTLEDRS